MCICSGQINKNFAVFFIAVTIIKIGTLRRTCFCAFKKYWACHGILQASIFLVYKIDFTIVQLLFITYFIVQKSIIETTEYFKQTYNNRKFIALVNLQITISGNTAHV